MRLPKKTKWVKKKNERRKGWQTCFGQLRGKGWCSCLLNGATLHTPDEWTGGGADISTVIYHPARPARKPGGSPPPHTGPRRRRRTRTENRERGETRKRGPRTRSVLRCTLSGPSGPRANPHYHASRLPSHYLVVPIPRSNFIRNPDTDIPQR